MPIATRPVPSSRARRAGASASSTGSDGLAGGGVTGSGTRRLHLRSGPPTKSTLVGDGDLSHTQIPTVHDLTRGGGSRWLLSKPQSTNFVRSSRPTAPRPNGAGTCAVGSPRSRTRSPAPGATSRGLAGSAAQSSNRARHQLHARATSLAAGVLDKLDTDEHHPRDAPAAEPTWSTTSSACTTWSTTRSPSSSAAPSRSGRLGSVGGWQRGRDSNPRLTSLPATAFKAVPIGRSGTPPGPWGTGAECSHAPAGA